jgi:hypothetical protein
MDSTDAIKSLCSLDLDGFTVKFFYARLDKKNGQLQLIGRVCLCGKGYSEGLPDVEIFKAVRSEDKLINRMHVSKVTEGNKDMANDVFSDKEGFFDITLKIGKNESLFFYNPYYFLREFEVYKLFQ